MGNTIEAAWHVHRDEKAVRLMHEPYCNSEYKSEATLVSLAHGTCIGSDSLPAYHAHKHYVLWSAFRDPKKRNPKRKDKPTWLVRRQRTDPYRGGPSVAGLNELAYHALNELRDLEKRV